MDIAFFFRSAGCSIGGHHREAGVCAVAMTCPPLPRNSSVLATGLQRFVAPDLVTVRENPLIVFRGSVAWGLIASSASLRGIICFPFHRPLLTGGANIASLASVVRRRNPDAADGWPPSIFTHWNDVMPSGAKMCFAVYSSTGMPDAFLTISASNCVEPPL